MANITPPMVEKYLKGIEYPATRDDIVTTARENNADDEVIDVLDMIPDREYADPADVSREVANRS